ncbi:MAG: hypothetical protein H6838_18215 [Planctomycetes bacterium]|nr:hypothetical protein [Planctomycetota bacterium]
MIRDLPRGRWAFHVPAFLWISFCAWWSARGGEPRYSAILLLLLVVPALLFWGDLREESRAESCDRAFRAEWAHAQAHWQELRIGADEARAAGQDLEAYVRSRGYRAEGVVMAIVHDLDTGRVL